MTKTIAELQNTPVAGNHGSDFELLSDCGRVVHDKTRPMEDRIAALSLIDRILGCEGNCTKRDVMQYVKETS